MSATRAEELRRELLQRRTRELRADRAAQQRIQPTPRAALMPSSVQQEGLWLHTQLEPGNPTYHMAICLNLRGPLDLDAMGAAVRVITARHDSFRTSFGTVDGGLVTRIGSDSTVRLTCHLLADEDVEDWVRARVATPFDLAEGPLARFDLARVTPERHVLVFAIHHIVCDGWSVGVLARELADLYAAAAAGRDAELAPVELQPVDHAAWQRRSLTSPEFAQQLAHWRDHLDGLPDLALPADRPRPALPSSRGDCHARDLPVELSAAVDRYVAEHRVSAYAVMLAAFAVVLARQSRQDDLAVGAVASGRTRRELEDVVGFLVTTVVLRLRTRPDATFADLVTLCREEIAGAMAHQDVPFGSVVQALSPGRAVGRNPLFQVCFAFSAPEVSPHSLTFPGLAVTPRQDALPTSRFDLMLQVTQRREQPYEVVVEYSAELFEPGRVAALADQFERALAAGLDDSGRSVAECLVLTDEEAAAASSPWSTASARAVAAPTPAGATPATAEAVTEHVVPRLRALWSEIFGIAEDAIEEDVTFFETGGTSIQAVALRQRLGDQFGTDVPLSTIFAEGSISELAALLQRR